jgi:hypothetical protein
MKITGDQRLKLNIAPADAHKIHLQTFFRMKVLARDEKRQVVKISRRIPGANRLGSAEVRRNDNPQREQHNKTGWLSHSAKTLLYEQSSRLYQGISYTSKETNVVFFLAAPRVTRIEAFS